jgi:hypothetical protein
MTQMALGPGRFNHVARNWRKRGNTSSIMVRNAASIMQIEACTATAG